MIIRKSNEEIELLRQAGKIVALTHQYLKPFIKPGISTKELDDLAEKFILSQGATCSFKGYQGFPGAICTSVNDVLVHGIPSKDVILKDVKEDMEIEVIYQWVINTLHQEQMI